MYLKKFKLTTNIFLESVKSFGQSCLNDAYCDSALVLSCINDLFSGYICRYRGYSIYKFKNSLFNIHFKIEKMQ